MSLRTRLVVAFFLLSVVPLAAVTVVSYVSSARALRDVAEQETDLLAGELGQRMQLVTAQLRERVEHLVDLAELQAEVERVTARASEPQPAVTAAETAVASLSTFDGQVARALGEAAVLLNNVELRGLRGGRGRGGPGDAPPPGTARPPTSGGEPPRPPDQAGREDRPRPTGARSQGGRGRSGDPTVPPPAGQVTPPPGPPVPPAIAPPGTAAADRLVVDMSAIRREMLRELIPEGQFENLTPEERAKLGRELNARMLGIAQGIQLGAAQLQKQVEDARKEAQAAAARAPTAVAAKAPALQTQKKSELSGTQLGVTVVRDGEVVQQLSAEINLPNVLATVFSTTRRDRGEVPFAVDREGKIYTPTEGDRAVIDTLGEVATPGGPASARVNNWIVVTTTDPAGAGLKLGIARPVGDSLAELRRTAVGNAGLGLGFIVLSLVIIVPISSRLTRRLSLLNDGVRRIARGDYRARVPVRSGDEVGQLASAFNQMAEDVERHQRAAVEQERIKRELELGRQIQHDMLPHAPLTVGLTEVRGVSVPAREVGGDFFNYFVLDNGQLALLVGDVSGKGVGAALLMANIQASLRTRLALGQDLAAIAEAIDWEIEAGSPGPLYATLFLGIFDPATRRLRYVNAGHHPQYILRTGGGLDAMPATGLPVGLFAGRGHQAQAVDLVAGDVMFFYTDGCVEAENEAADDMFGSDRLEAVLRAQPAGPGDVLARVEAAVKAFRGTRELSDDATTMTVRVG